MKREITIEDFTRVNNDTNGNPRYVLHFLAFITTKDSDYDISGKYELALKRSRKFGGRKFHNKQYGGGIVFQSYNVQRELCDKINAYIKTLEAE